MKCALLKAAAKRGVLAAALCVVAATAAAGATEPAKQQSDKTQAANRPMLGVVLADSGNQAVITELYQGSPAEQAGLRSGDRVVSVDGHAVASRQQIKDQLAQRQPGEIIKLTVTRGGWQRDFQITLGAHQSVINLPVEATVEQQQQQHEVAPQVLTGDPDDAEKVRELDDPGLRAVDTDFGG